MIRNVAAALYQIKLLLRKPTNESKIERIHRNEYIAFKVFVALLIFMEKPP